MKTPQRSQKLNSIGVLLVARLLSIQPRGINFDLFDNLGTKILVRVQNRLIDQELGDCCTINVDEAPYLTNTKNLRLIFVDYDDPQFIRVHECTDRGAYTMKNFRGDAWKGLGNRLMCCYPIAGMKLLHEVRDAQILNDMKSLSEAKKFNINSKQYGRAAA
jgi:hypothetical protein